MVGLAGLHAGASSARSWVNAKEAKNRNKVPRSTDKALFKRATWEERLRKECASAASIPFSILCELTSVWRFSRISRRQSASRSEERHVGKECRSRWSP